MRALLAALLCVLSVPALAKPSQYGVDSFSGDRYIRVAQPAAARDVNRSMRCPPPHCQRGRASKAKYLYRTKKRQIVPVPARRPGAVSPLTQASAVEPLSAARGFGREVRNALPSRFVRGRLICAVNVGAELAARGVTPPKTRLAKDYLKWGRAAGPQPGAVAVFSRGKRGGHVAIVHSVKPNGEVIYLNPSSRRQAWVIGPYRKRPIAFRVAS